MDHNYRRTNWHKPQDGAGGLARMKMIGQRFQSLDAQRLHSRRCVRCGLCAAAGKERPLGLLRRADTSVSRLPFQSECKSYIWTVSKEGSSSEKVVAGCHSYLRLPHQRCSTATPFDPVAEKRRSQSRRCDYQEQTRQNLRYKREQSSRRSRSQLGGTGGVNHRTAQPQRGGFRRVAKAG